MQGTDLFIFPFAPPRLPALPVALLLSLGPGSTCHSSLRHPLSALHPNHPSYQLTKAISWLLSCSPFHSQPASLAHKYHWLTSPLRVSLPSSALFSTLHRIPSIRLTSWNLLSSSRCLRPYNDSHCLPATTYWRWARSAAGSDVHYFIQSFKTPLSGLWKLSPYFRWGKWGEATQLREMELKPGHPSCYSDSSAPHKIPPNSPTHPLYPLQAEAVYWGTSSMAMSF